jgi:hypothetical protein
LAQVHSLASSPLCEDLQHGKQQHYIKPMRGTVLCLSFSFLVHMN